LARMGNSAEEELMQMMQTDKLELVSTLDSTCGNLETIE